MGDPPTPSPVLARAELARQVIENPIFQQAIEEMREEFINRWIQAPDGANEVKDLAHRYVRLLCVFEGLLKGYIEIGRAAQNAMEPVEFP